jgi:DNA-binding beta-propeller fold protein YncE
MAESPDGRTLWLAGPGYKRVIAIDIRTRKVMNSFSLSLPNWTLGSGTRISISPDGTRLALTDRETVAVVDLGTRKVVSRTSAKAVAVGWSPSGELRVLL